MLARLRTAAVLALAGLFLTTGAASAAVFELEDRTDVMVTTGIVVLIIVGITFLFYLLRHALGLDKMPPPEPTTGDHH